MTDTLLVISTFPSTDEARAIVRILVDERLAACGNIVPKVESIYRWQGAVETAGEVLVFLKTTDERFEALAERFRELHPYEVPELIAIDIRDGLPAYLNWVMESVAE